MSQPASTEATLVRLEARMDGIEAQLSRLTELLDQAMPAVAMTVDVIDEEVAKAQARGVDVDARARASLDLLEKATAPETLAALSAMAEQAESVAPLAELAGGTMAHIAMGVDVLDEEVAKAQARGVDVDERLRRAGGLLEKLTDPAVLDSLERALAHAQLLGEGAELAASAPGYTAMAIDIMDEEIGRLQAEGIDVDLAQENGLQFMRMLGRFFGSAQGKELLDSGLLDPHTIHRITQLSKAVVLTLDEDPALIGPWGSFVRTWDKRFQRFAGFSFALAWRVGALLGPNGKSLPAPRS